MEAGARSVLGFALVSVAHLGFGALFLGLAGFSVPLYGALGLLAGAGFLVAAAGCGHLASARGTRGLATGLVVAASAYVPITFLSFETPGNFKVGWLLLTISLAEASYYALAWHLEGPTRGVARAAGLRVGAVGSAAGFAYFAFLNLTTFQPFLLTSSAGLVGWLVVAKSLGGAAEVAERRAAQAEAAGSK